MNTIVKKVMVLLFLMTTTAYSKTSNNSVVINRMIMSNTLDNIIFDEYSPGKDVGTFTNNDKRIFYYVYFGIINPTKEKYQIEIICVDTKNNIIFKKSAERKLMSFSDYIGEDLVKNQEQIWGLDAKKGAMVNGQLSPLKDDNAYFIKLYIEKKLVGVSSFTYQLVT